MASWPLPNGAGVRKMMIMLAAGRMLLGAVFPLTGFTEMPKAGSVSQLVPQPGQQMLQQPVQQTMQPQPSVMSIPPELVPKLQMYRAMQARFGAAGRNVGLPFTGNVGDFLGSLPHSGTTNPTQQHQQLPSGINLDMIQALIHRKQDG